MALHEALAALKNPAPAQPSAKRQAVGGKIDEQLKGLIVSTAKSVVGLDVIQRRHQGCLSQVILLPHHNPYVTELIEVGRRFDAKKKELKENGDHDQIAQLTPVHILKWGALAQAVVDDASIPEDKKAGIAQHLQTAQLADMSALVITCMCKKAFKQQGWSHDKYKIELMTVPELRPVMLELMSAMRTKPESEIKKGQPPRTKNVRSVVEHLIQMGEFEAEEK